MNGNYLLTIIKEIEEIFEEYDVAVGSGYNEFIIALAKRVWQEGYDSYADGWNAAHQELTEVNDG